MISAIAVFACLRISRYSRSAGSPQLQVSSKARDLRVALAALPALAQNLQIVGEVQPLHGVFSDTVRRL